jgi:hypothetical protein
LTLSNALPAGTYYVNTIAITGDTKLSEILSILNPPMPPTPTNDHALLEAIRKILIEQQQKEKKP